MKKIIIAIDGPAASGKSTTAKRVASVLGYLHIDTGAMYRAIALKVLRHKIEPSDSSSIAALASSTSVQLQLHNGNVDVLLDGILVNEEIRSPEVTNIVSAVSAVSRVRELMVNEQRAMGKNGGIVLEGRDIGTVVFPSAELKIFMIADARERAVRRQKEMQGKGVAVDLDNLKNEIAERDRIDSTREASPLKKADDAVVLDTTHLSIDEQVQFIVARAKEKIE